MFFKPYLEIKPLSKMKKPLHAHIAPNVPSDSKEKKLSLTNILKNIPSTVMSPERIEEERRLSRESKARKSEISKKYNEEISIRTVDPKRNRVETDPTITGKATLKLCCEIGIDQLCCHYNQDYSLLATGGADGVVRLYDTPNFDFAKSIRGGNDTEGFTSCVTCIKHKPVLKPDQIDNHFTFTYVNGIVKCFNYKSKECIFTINEKRQTYGLAFHPRLNKFVTFGDDLKINLYDYETQVKERTFKRSGKKTVHDGHTSRVFAAQFNPASNAEFLSGGWDNTVFLWDLRQPHGIRYISDVNLCGEGLDIDQMGRQVLTCSWRNENPLQLWDYSTFQLIATITPDDYASRLYCGRFIGSELIACGGSNPSTFRVVNKESGKSRVVIANLPSDVYHFDVGKPIKFSTNQIPTKKKKTSKVMPDEEDHSSEVDLIPVPNIMFLAGGKIYQVKCSASAN
ncbi:uncharacterized protein LOC123314319 [Coccinella septempunctata]|uniref:uncharacterized protein LOC123314319 n=1 Tax=Coccinella septempunctata TaxID=41139 RepID=UPI001D06FB54|nr:uncharacterized protein LOC123314319 [Coccinella septempunctata]